MDVEEAPMPMFLTTKKFQFLSDDVDAQLRVSRNIAKCAQDLDDVIKRIGGEEKPEETLSLLRSIRNELIIQGGELANNAGITSSTASNVISDVSSGST